MTSFWKGKRKLYQPKVNKILDENCWFELSDNLGQRRSKAEIPA
jgi:hypothetical protein